MKPLFISLAALFVFTGFSNADLPPAINGDLTMTDNEPPRSSKACWVVFGTEVLCLTYEEEDIKLPDIDELKINVEFASTGDYMNLIFPRNVGSGSIRVTETLNFTLCSAGNKSIRKGTKINIRNGEAKVSLR